MRECYNAAIKLLARSEKTVDQLKKKLLEKEFPAEEIELTVAKLIDYNFVNDERFAKQFAQNRQKKKSNRQIVYELRQKGVAEETAQNCLTDLSDEQERCLRLGQEKFNKLAKKINRPNDSQDNHTDEQKLNPRLHKETTQKTMNKVQFYLASKGFSLQEINKAIKIIFS